MLNMVKDIWDKVTEVSICIFMEVFMGITKQVEHLYYTTDYYKIWNNESSVNIKLALEFYFYKYVILFIFKFA